MELSNYPPTTNLQHDKQLMLAFAFMADVQSGAPNKKAVDGEANIKKLWNTQTHPATAALLEGWQLVYGPSVYTLAGGPARNTTVIFYNPNNSGHMVVGVAGTNFISSYDWFKEDVDVMNLVPWNKTIMAFGADNGGTPTGGHVSAGTARALYHTWNHSLRKNKKDTHITPINWLKDNMADYPTAKLTVTGHSLGGAISPALALALHENRENWNGFQTNGKDITVDTYIFAGPSPGDEVFTDYVGKQITYHSFRNTNDVVPHAWVIDELKDLHTLFNPVLMQAGPDNNGCIVYWVIESLVAEATKAFDDGYTYVRWNQETEFTCPLSTITQDNVKKAQDKAAQLLKYMKPSRINDLYTLTKAVREIEPIETDPKNAVLLPYLTYFVEFMGTLSDQHTTAYQNHIFNNTQLETELKSIFYVKKDNAAAGLDFLYVVEELIKDITIYYTKYRKKEVAMTS